MQAARFFSTRTLLTPTSMSSPSTFMTPGETCQIKLWKGNRECSFTCLISSTTSQRSGNLHGVVSVATTFGQTWFGHLYLAAFGQTEFGQYHVWPFFFWWGGGVFEGWGVRGVGARRGGCPDPEKVGPGGLGPRRVGGPKGGGPKISRFFFPTFALFVSLSGGLVFWCLEAPGPSNVQVMAAFGQTAFGQNRISPE